MKIFNYIYILGLSNRIIYIRDIQMQFNSIFNFKNKIQIELLDLKIGLDKNLDLKKKKEKSKYSGSWKGDY